MPSQGKFETASKERRERDTTSWDRGLRPALDLWPSFRIEGRWAFPFLTLLTLCTFYIAVPIHCLLLIGNTMSGLPFCNQGTLWQKTRYATSCNRYTTYLFCSELPSALNLIDKSQTLLSMSVALLLEAKQRWVFHFAIRWSSTQASLCQFDVRCKRTLSCQFHPLQRREASLPKS